MYHACRAIVALAIVVLPSLVDGHGYLKVSLYLFYDRSVCVEEYVSCIDGGYPSLSIKMHDDNCHHRHRLFIIGSGRGDDERLQYAQSLDDQRAVVNG